MFVGADTDANEEARFFQAINRRVLRALGGDWHRPETPVQLLGEKQVRSLAVEVVRKELEGLRTVRYLGISRLIRARLGRLPDEPWGWKDPRNTLTLPLWIELFPRLRVVHVTRHGVDVAASLANRGQDRLRSLQTRKASESDSRRLGVDWISDALYCRSIEEGFALWKRYVDQGRRWKERLTDRYLEIRFENLVQNPVSGIGDLRSFAGMDLPESESGGSSPFTLEPSRANAYLKNAELREFAQAHENDLRERGYAVD